LRIKQTRNLQRSVLLQIAQVLFQVNRADKQGIRIAVCTRGPDIRRMVYIKQSRCGDRDNNCQYSCGGFRDSL